MTGIDESVAPTGQLTKPGLNASAVKAAVDLPELCDDLGIDLTKQDDGRWTGVCPFHENSGRKDLFACYKGDDRVWRCGCWACQPFPGEQSTGDCFDLVRAWEMHEGRPDPGFRWAVSEVVRRTGGRGPAERHRDRLLDRIDGQGRDEQDTERCKATVRDWYRRGLFGAVVEDAAAEQPGDGDDGDGDALRLVPWEEWSRKE